MTTSNCRRCATPNPESSRFCSHCGEGLESSNSPGSPQEAKAPRDLTLLTGTQTRFVPSTREATQPGKPFGTRYVLLEPLGKGGMGEVWRAQDKELQQVVALKMIRPDLAEDPNLLERLRHEITLARKVTHKNVTRIHDLGEAEGTRFISMEYLEGKNLKDLIRDGGALSHEAAIPIMKGICEGLLSAHEAGIVHRDLKPQNILIDPSGQAHIMDFGIAASGETAGLTRTGAVIGTPEYMSPEQVRGERVDLRSDIYSLGLIFYEMVTGDLPFAADSAVSAMFKRLTEKPRRPRELKREIPVFIETIILRCLEREKALRYSGVGQILNDLQEQQASTARLARLSRVVASRGVVYGGLGLALAVCVAAGIVLVRRERARRDPLSAAGAARALALLPFQNETGSADLDWTRTGLAALVSRGLQGSPGLRVLGSDRTQQTLDDLKLSLSGRYDPFDLKRAGSVLGAEVLITGTVRRSGGDLQAEARLQRADRSGLQDIGVVTASSQGDNAVPALAETLAGKIARALNVQPAGNATSRHPTTKSAQALRLYSEGLELSQEGKDLEAAKRLEEAVSQDRGFALAQALLSQVYTRLGDGDRAQSHSEEAVKNLGSVSDREARLIRARNFQLEQKPDQAVQEYRALIQAYPLDPEPRYELGGVLEEKGDLVQAGAEFERCTALDPQHAAARYALGRIRLAQGDSAAALKVFSELLATYTQAANEEGTATALHAIGNVRVRTGDPEEALRSFRQALEIRTRIGDRRGMAASLSGIATALKAEARYQEAIQAARQALDLRTERGDKPGTASALMSLGEVYEEAGQFQEARKCYQDSLAIVRDLNDPSLLAATVSSLGYISSVLGDYAGAYLLYEEALAKRREIGDRRELLRSLIEVGLIEQVQGRYEKALGYAAEASGLAREIGERAGAVVLSINVGMIHDDQGSYAAALKSLSEAAEAARSIGDKNLLASALLYQGGALVHLGNFRDAEARLTEAEGMIRDLKMETLLPELLDFRAEVDGQKGQTADGLKRLDESRRKSESLGDRRLVLVSRLNLGRWSLAAGRPDGPSHLSWVAAEAKKMGLLPLRVRALAALGSSPAQGETGAAAAGQALREGKEANLRESLVEASWALARRALARGDPSEAKRLFAQAAMLVRGMAEGLDEPNRTALVRRADLARLAEEAQACLSAHGTAEEKAESARLFPRP